ncbi:MAG: histidine phosphatase family protein [Oscillospiraceae bacterium]|nr:histidine phosphatase family protein [Oscillospiraceae bacterium]
MSSDNKLQTVLLLRHGETQGNRERRYNGATDEPLCPEGIAALRAREPLEAEALYVSPMLRCRQTAELMFPALRPSVASGLREMDFGAFEGKNHAELKRDAEYIAWLDGGCEGQTPRGEGKADFCGRCCAAFAEIMAAERHAVVAFVIHGGTIMAIMERFALPRRSYWEWNPPNAGGYVCRWNGAALIDWRETP